MRIRVRSQATAVDLGSGHARISLQLKPDLFYKVLGEQTNLDIRDEAGLLDCMLDMARMKKKYEKIGAAYDDVLETGYGIVMPSMEELTLEEPEIIKQGGKFGIRLKAGAPSIHMLQTRITTEVTPIVGSEQQSEELVMYLLNQFEEEPSKIWESNIFGKSLHELVNEGLHNKLLRMPADAGSSSRRPSSASSTTAATDSSASYFKLFTHPNQAPARTKSRGLRCVTDQDRRSRCLILRIVLQN